MVGNLQELLSTMQHSSEKYHLKFLVPKAMARSFSVIESLKLDRFCEKQIQVFLRCMLVTNANAHSLGFCVERSETTESSNGFENSLQNVRHLSGVSCVLIVPSEKNIPFDRFHRCFFSRFCLATYKIA